MLVLLYEAWSSFNIWFVAARFETCSYYNLNALEVLMVLYKSLLNVVVTCQTSIISNKKTKVTCPYSVKAQEKGKRDIRATS